VSPWRIFGGTRSVIKKLLNNSDFSLLEKMKVMNMLFDHDPEYTQKARDIVRSNSLKAHMLKEVGS